MRNPNNNSCLDFIFRTPKKLEFESLYRYYFDFILRLLYRVIIFEDIPETVSETFLKMILYTQGKACFLRGNLIDEGEELLALNCTRADTPDVYYIPHKVLVTNPRLKQSYNIEPGKDCEIVYLSEPDKYALGEFGGGLYELIRRTATMLADNDISINIAQKNTRLVNLVSGDTQNTVDSIRAVITAMYEGDPTIVVKSSLIDKLQGIPLIQNTSQQNLVQLIEVQQYIIAHFYEQIGITTHDQMKRERLITAEINDNLDLAFLNIDDILESVSEGLDRVNKMFGTNITCKLNPIIERQRERAEEQLEAELEGDQSEPEEDAAQTEAEPEQESDAQSEADTEPEAEPEAAAPEEPEQESEPEEDAAAEPEDAAQSEAEPEPDIQESEINVEISGNNNVIIIGGDDNADDKPEEDDPPDVSQSDGGDRSLDSVQSVSDDTQQD